MANNSMLADVFVAGCRGEVLVPNGLVEGRTHGWRSLFSGHGSCIQLLQQDMLYKILVTERGKNGGQLAVILNTANYEVKKEEWHEIKTSEGKLFAFKFDKNDKQFVVFQAEIKRVLQLERHPLRRGGRNREQTNTKCSPGAAKDGNMASGREVADAIPFYSSESSFSGNTASQQYVDMYVNAIPKEPYDSTEEWKYKGGGGHPRDFSAPTASFSSKAKAARSYSAYAPPPEAHEQPATPLSSRGGAGGVQRREEQVHSRSLSTGLQNLIESLQSAIYKGEGEQAAIVAKSLAIKRANIKMELYQSGDSGKSTEKMISLKVYVEDKSNSGTSIMLKVRLSMTIRDLKRHMFLEHQFPPEVQRWIIGKSRAKDDDHLNKFKQLIHDGSPVYLYLMSAKSVGLPGRQVYEREHNMGQADLIPVDVCDEPAVAAPTTPPHPASQQRAAAPGHQNVPEPRRPSGSEETLRPPQQQQQQRLQQLPQQQQRQQQLPQQQQRQQQLPQQQQQPVDTAEGWSCPQCTYVNLPLRPGCAMCAADRPADYREPDNYVPTDEELQMMAQQQELDRQALEADRQMRRPYEDEDPVELFAVPAGQLEMLLQESQNQTARTTQAVQPTPDEDVVD